MRREKKAQGGGSAASTNIYVSQAWSSDHGIIGGNRLLKRWETCVVQCVPLKIVGSFCLSLSLFVLGQEENGFPPPHACA